MGNKELFFIGFDDQDRKLAEYLQQFFFTKGYNARLISGYIAKEFDLSSPEIAGKLAGMTHLIILTSSEAIQSNWVKRAFQYALEKHCKIYSVIFNDVKLDSTWDFLLENTEQYLASTDTFLWIKNVGSAILETVQADKAKEEEINITLPTDYVKKAEEKKPPEPPRNTIVKPSVSSLTPYEGKEPYIFISYSHKDSGRVIPIIGQMLKDGYNVWYDEGIDPGTEWDKFIATHIENCSHFIAMISKNFLSSDNCLDELALSRELKIQRLLVYLEDVSLPTELKMRHGRLQAIHHYKYNSNPQAFYDKLYHTNMIECCLHKK